eukprot:SAG22_NODE_13663_length_398_cov_3.421405_1_plen_62_part_10
MITAFKREDLGQRPLALGGRQPGPVVGRHLARRPPHLLQLGEQDVEVAQHRVLPAAAAAAAG